MRVWVMVDIGPIENRIDVFQTIGGVTDALFQMMDEILGEDESGFKPEREDDLDTLLEKWRNSGVGVPNRILLVEEKEVQA